MSASWPAYPKLYQSFPCLPRWVLSHGLNRPPTLMCPQVCPVVNQVCQRLRFASLCRFAPYQGIIRMLICPLSDCYALWLLAAASQSHLLKMPEVLNSGEQAGDMGCSLSVQQSAMRRTTAHTLGTAMPALRARIVCYQHSCRASPPCGTWPYQHLCSDHLCPRKAGSTSSTVMGLS